ncbi:Tex family protein [Halalkalibacterium halodurans]|uniref:Tex family protein n=1 Tax=Halalkalibacterium halodurans TaxID=86665 RepID=UPI002E202120|nr:Tex family protein [Halalkalibacterium halodurans]MED4085263.1 Tex family protein [Halalkalibacterium halodurans]MED4103796.1 Tex family protein [Halalkalibacterium halodurans]MED4107249.1 Tex family protein [Halalkalibacterium halodurans]MED4150382.1 Tex family protein [Halalkalibacterium halodurans]
MSVPLGFEEHTIKTLAKELSLKPNYIKQVIQLLHEGNTVPFIARYRKELTGGMDEVKIREVSEKWTYANQLHERKEEVIRLVEEQGKLTDEWKKAVEQAQKLQEVEDLYRPYKQKRRTRATVAKEKGLEPLAEWLFSLPRDGDPLQEAEVYFSVEHELTKVEDVLQGAQDIIAEWIADDADLRKRIRSLGFKEGSVIAKVKKEELDEKGVYEMYYDYEEPVRTLVPHRTLALNRGEKEDVLRVTIRFPVDRIIEMSEKTFIRRFGSPAVPYVKAAIEDGYKRLIEPSIEREIRHELTEKVEEQAIHIFAENLRSLLLQPPIKGKVVLGLDPAYRTGCKLAIVDETGKVLDIQVIYPTPPRNEVEAAKKIVKKLIADYGVEMIAIGNGTASRESEQFIADLIKDLPQTIYYLIVNEAGASVYSASEIGREEFPDLQVEERSAVSIARRLQDPLAELVKIDPKSVGVGQYQHDVSQKRLNESLTFVVETVVNQVGVNVNTASPSLLQYVAGLSKTVAKNIVKKREEAGRFTARAQLKDIPRLGAKTYEQCIGFLRIMDGDNLLDATAIHPESYKVTDKLLSEVGATAADVGTEDLKKKLQALDVSAMAATLDVGVPTLKDMIDALIRPTRDPRDEVAKPLLKQDVLQLEDLLPGMELQGTVRNVVDFGVFVDIGVKQDGLVHISKLANRYIKHPLEVVTVGEIVTVWVEDVDIKKGRIALTMLRPEDQNL